MNRMIFVNLPVKDLKASMAFFQALDWSFNPDYTDENAACLILSDTIYVMLLKEDFYKSFTHKEIPDTKTHSEVILAISADSRNDVDLLVDKAFAAGATHYNDPQVYDFMYSRSFQDPDHHLWEVVYMEEVKPEEVKPEEVKQ